MLYLHTPILSCSEPILLTRNPSAVPLRALGLCTTMEHEHFAAPEVSGADSRSHSLRLLAGGTLPRFGLELACFS